MGISPLPHNVEAEAEILGSILNNNNNIMDAMEIITANDFYRDSHKHIYKAMLELYKDGITIDLVTLTNKLNPILKEIGGITYLSILLSSSMGKKINNHCDIVKESSIKRQLIKSCNDALASAYKHESNAKEIINQFESSLLSMNIDKGKNGLISFEEVMEQTI